MTPTPNYVDLPPPSLQELITLGSSNPLTSAEDLHLALITTLALMSHISRETITLQKEIGHVTASETREKINSILTHTLHTARSL